MMLLKRLGFTQSDREGWLNIRSLRNVTSAGLFARLVNDMQSSEVIIYGGRVRCGAIKTRHVTHTTKHLMQQLDRPVPPLRIRWNAEVIRNI
jgi:hypothetical protein